MNPIFQFFYYSGIVFCFFLFPQTENKKIFFSNKIELKSLSVFKTGKPNLPFFIQFEIKNKTKNIIKIEYKADPLEKINGKILNSDGKIVSNKIQLIWNAELSPQPQVFELNPGESYFRGTDLFKILPIGERKQGKYKAHFFFPFGEEKTNTVILDFEIEKK